MSAPPSHDVDQVAGRGRGPGCLAVFLLGLCGLFLAVVGGAGGLLGYGFSRWLGTPTLGASIAAGVIAFGIVCLTTPLGMGLYIASYPDKEHPLIRSMGVLVLATLGPIFKAPVVLVFAALAAVGGGMLFHWCEPLTASIFLAVLFPLVGVVSGILIADGVG